MLVFDNARVIDLNADIGRGVGQHNRTSNLAIVQAEPAAVTVHEVEFI